MNDPFAPRDLPEDPWRTRAAGVGTPGASTTPGDAKSPASASATLNRAVDAAHQAVDRFADRAAPQVRQLGETVAGAEAALQDRADALGRTRDAWAEGLRRTVRDHPLAALAAALALGAAIVRVTR